MIEIRAVCRYGLYRGTKIKFPDMPEVQPGTVPTKGGVTVRLGGAPEAGLVSCWVLVGDVLHLWKGWVDIDTTKIMQETGSWDAVMDVAYKGMPPFDDGLAAQLSQQFPFEWELI